MSGQVSGSDLTLLEAIKSGEVTRPPLLKWNDWQRWRRDIGRRPSTAVDGFTTPTTQESALYKAVMLDLYGPDWGVQVAMLDVEGPRRKVQRQYVTEKFLLWVMLEEMVHRDGVRSPIPVRPAEVSPGSGWPCAGNRPGKRSECFWQSEVGYSKSRLGQSST